MDENNDLRVEEELGEEQEPEEKRFTQAEVDALISKRIAKERRGMPKAEELAAFREWQKGHADNTETLESVTSERDAAQSDLEMTRRENYMLRKGVPADDVDYFVYKVSKAMEDGESFEDAAEKYLKENKRSTVRMDTGARLSGKASEKTANEAMNALIRSAGK